MGPTCSRNESTIDAATTTALIAAVLGLQKNGAATAPAAGSSARLRHPLRCAGEEGGGAGELWTIAREVRKGHTWRAAEHASDERGAGESAVAAYRGAISCMCTHEELSSSCQPAPDALDELRDAVHRVAVVRHDAAHAPLHMHQLSVPACEQQMAALALAVISQRHLREGQVARDNTLRELTPGGRAMTCTVRASTSV